MHTSSTCSCQRTHCQSPALMRQALIAQDTLSLLHAHIREIAEKQAMLQTLHQDRLGCLAHWQERYQLSLEQQRALGISFSHQGRNLQTQLAQQERMARFFQTHQQHEAVWYRQTTIHLHGEQQEVETAIQVHEALLAKLAARAQPTRGCLIAVLEVMDQFLPGVKQDLARLEADHRQVQGEINALNASYQQEAARLAQFAQETAMSLGGAGASTTTLLRWGWYVASGFGPRVSLRDSRLENHLVNTSLEFQQYDAQQRHFWTYSQQYWPLHLRAITRLRRVEALREQLDTWQRERARVQTAHAPSGAAMHLPLLS